MGIFSAIRGAVRQVVNTVKEAVNRVIGLPDFVGNLIGIVPRKKLRLRIVILRDEDGSALASPADLDLVVQRTKAIFDERFNTRIVASGGVLIETYDPIPPPEALEPRCDFDGWLQDFSAAGDFYSLKIATNLAAAPTGYATPITVFIVKDVQGKKGCSLGPLTNYVTYDVSGLTPAPPNPNDDVNVPEGQLWLAHELAHACGLWHSRQKKNLMHKSADTGTEVRRWEVAIARNSRHVTFF